MYSRSRFHKSQDPNTSTRTPVDQRLQSSFLQNIKKQARAHALIICVNDLTLAELLAVPHIESLVINDHFKIASHHSVYECMPKIGVYNPNHIIFVSDDPFNIEAALDQSCWAIAVTNEQPKSESDTRMLSGAHHQIKSLHGLIPAVLDINLCLQKGEFPISFATLAFNTPSLDPSPLPNVEEPSLVAFR